MSSRSSSSSRFEFCVVKFCNVYISSTEFHLTPANLAGCTKAKIVYFNLLYGIYNIIYFYSTEDRNT